MEKAGGAPVATVGWRSVAATEQLSLGGTLENKNNPAQRDMCEKERVRKEEQEKGETPDGGSVTNGDAAATCEAKVPARSLRGYIYGTATNSARCP